MFHSFILLVVLCVSSVITASAAPHSQCPGVCREAAVQARKDCLSRSACVVKSCNRPSVANGYICEKGASEPTIRVEELPSKVMDASEWKLISCYASQSELPVALFTKKGSSTAYNTDFPASDEDIACFNASKNREIRFHMGYFNPLGCAPLRLPTHRLFGKQVCPTLSVESVCPAALEAMLALLRYGCA